MENQINNSQMAVVKNSMELNLNRNIPVEKIDYWNTTILTWLFFIFFPLSLVVAMIVGIIYMTNYVFQLFVDKWHRLK